MYARLRVAVVATALVMLLGACDTQPATEVTPNSAVLNGKGACAAGLAGWWRYQIRNVSAGGSFYGVGPQHDFNCSANTAEVALPGHRATGLNSATYYEFRIRTQLNNGDSFWQDANGTRNGTAYDWFITPSPPVNVVDEHPAETYPSIDPETGGPVASAAGCHTKEITNTRRAHSSWFGTHLWTIQLRTAWRYCNGQIVKMYPAYAQCWTTSGGSVSGYECKNPDGAKVRAISTGGTPEHAVYTYSFRIEQTIRGHRIFSTLWCATNQISGSGAHRRHGSCDIQPW
jgi:hypothetical protein